VSFLVVVNDEEQYSIWPSDREVPLGWRNTGFGGAEEECLAHIESVWTDLRPASVRKKVGAGRNVIGTSRLTLRELSRQDAQAILDGEGDPEQWCAGYPHDDTEPAARGYLKRPDDQYPPGFGMYHIVRNSDGLVVGDIGFHTPPQDGVVEIGYGLAEVARGQGYATEALTALTAWALAHPDVRRVLAETTPENAPSQRVMERSGFERTGADESRVRYVAEPSTGRHP
jgi:RimJ/RimL family protein N-acetyltransferase/uncharacterized protein YbdZ (MbtH family)